MAMVHVYTGEGEGKTLAVLGLALRAIGHGKKVVMIQFMKGRKDTGEYLVKDRLKPEFELYQFGRGKFVNLENPEDVDRKFAIEGLKFAIKILDKKPDILILDEINLALAIGLLDIKDVINLLDKLPEEMTVVLTGRKAPKEIIDRADLVTEMRYIMHPFERGMGGRKGLDY